MAILTYILIGVVVGLFGRLALPTPQQVGFWSTLLLGMVGGIVGGILSSMIAPYGMLAPPRPLGMVLAAVGAVVVVVTVVVATQRRVHE